MVKEADKFIPTKSEMRWFDDITGIDLEPILYDRFYMHTYNEYVKKALHEFDICPS